MLTGTPLQNDLEELQNLLQFLLPDVFSKDEFSQSEDLQASEHRWQETFYEACITACIATLASQLLYKHLVLLDHMQATSS